MFRIFTSLILIGISEAGFFMFISPTYEEVSVIKEKIASYNSALDNAKALENERDRLTAKYNAIDPTNIEKLEKLLPDNVDNIRLILEIEKIALPYGMTIKNVQYAADESSSKTSSSTSTAGGGIAMNMGTGKGVVSGGTETDSARKEYGIWNLSFSTQSTYNNFLNFVKDLESNLRIVDVSAVKFAAGDTGGVNPNFTESYRYDFSIKTYWLKN